MCQSVLRNETCNWNCLTALLSCVGAELEELTQLYNGKNCTSYLTYGAYTFSLSNFVPVKECVAVQPKCAVQQIEYYSSLLNTEVFYLCAANATGPTLKWSGMLSDTSYLTSVSYMSKGGNPNTQCSKVMPPANVTQFPGLILGYAFIANGNCYPSPLSANAFSTAPGYFKATCNEKIGEILNCFDSACTNCPLMGGASNVLNIGCDESTYFTTVTSCSVPQMSQSNTAFSLKMSVLLLGCSALLLF